jgi:quercetin dioxygenase-like cupin family protein
MTDQQTAGQALRPAGGGFALIRIADEIARLKAKLDSSAADREAASLVKDYGLNVMLMALKRGARLHEHHTKGPLTVQVLSGAVRFVAAGTPNEVAAGTIFALDREVPHSVDALEDSVLLMTVALG